MKEIEDKLEELHRCYVQQRQAYSSVLETASEEKTCIERRDMTRLLPILERKQQAITEAGRNEERIEALQEQLAAVFRLNGFSLKELRNASSPRYHGKIDQIQEEVGALLKDLEKLEVQERLFENELRKISETGKGPSAPTQKVLQRQAQRAYEKEK